MVNSVTSRRVPVSGITTASSVNADLGASLSRVKTLSNSQGVRRPIRLSGCSCAGLPPVLRLARCHVGKNCILLPKG